MFFVRKMKVAIVNIFTIIKMIFKSILIIN
nr:MAG TPA: hypothetical protein [Bacteriophage sp.]